MFTRIEVRNYRALKEIDLHLSNFHVLTGPNASGKTTLMDVFGFLSDLINDGLEAAVEKRTNNFYDLTFGGNGENIQFGLEASVPENLWEGEGNAVRYQILIGKTQGGNGIGVLSEALFIYDSLQPLSTIKLWDSRAWDDGIAQAMWEGTASNVFHKEGDMLRFFHEAETDFPPLELAIGSDRTGLSILPPDKTIWPISNWFAKLISFSIRTVMLDSVALRQASPFAKKGTFRPDGSRLPWMIEELKTHSPQLFEQWISHVRTALPDLKEIKTVLREDDRHRYLKLVYENGIECPSWTASDGTLRLLALTVIAFIDKFEGLYLIEEPENGIHPLAIETIFSSLSQPFDVQILLATHSPVIVSLVKAKDLLCFSKTVDGRTQIISGTDHPRLAHWKGELNLSMLFASGILD